MRAVAYVRVSTGEQNPAMQRAAVTRYAQGRDWQLGRVYEDHGLSGASARRPALTRLLEDAHRRQFDAVVVWKFDRFARSVDDLLASLKTFQALGIDFVSVTEGIDTTTVPGRLLFIFLAAVAEFERALIRERVRAGVRAKIARQGGRWGRPRVLTVRLLERVKRMRVANKSVRAIALELGLPRTSVRRALGQLAPRRSA